MFLPACAPQEQRYVAGDATARIDDTAFRTRDGTLLPLTVWKARHPAAVVLALHGFNDYRHSFAALGASLAARDITLIAYDQRGFGAAPAHGIWAGRDNLITDADMAARLLIAQNPDVPVYLLGESMGGSVVVETLARDPALPIAGAILSAPALWRVNAFYRGGLWLGAHVVPGKTVTGQGLRILACDNLEMLRALGRDPLVIKATRLDAIYGLVGLMAEAADEVAKVRTPLLLLYGAHDQVVPRTAMRLAIPRIQAPLRVAYYDHGYHMLERDLEGETVQADITGWILNHDAPLLSGADQNWLARMDTEKPVSPTPAEKRFRDPWHHRSAITSK